jgi:hypothetical protein
MNEGSSLAKEQNDEKLGLENRMDATYNPANNSSQYTSFSSVEIEYLMQRKERSLGNRAIVDWTQTGQNLIFVCDDDSTVRMSRTTAEMYIEEERRRLISYTSRLLKRVDIVLIPAEEISKINCAIEGDNQHLPNPELAYELVHRHGKFVDILDIYRDAEHLDSLLDLQEAVSELNPISRNSALLIPTESSRHAYKFERTTQRWMQYWRPPRSRYNLIRDGEELASHLENGKAQVVKNLSTIFETGRGITEQEFPRPRDLRIEEIYVLSPLETGVKFASPENGNEE